MNTSQKIVRLIIPLLILGIGFVAMRLLIFSRPAPQKQERPAVGALVESVDAAIQDWQVRIYATGTVQPAKELALTPQVRGLISWISGEMVAGGFFKKGDLLFAIEDVDYRLAAERAKAQVAKARLDLATVENRARVARDEWETLGRKLGIAPNPLVLHEPQVENARAAVAAAESSLEQAAIDLERTQIRAPFNCRIRSEQIEKGFYVRDGASVAVIAGTDSAEIIVPVSPADMQWLEIPQPGKAHTFTAATVSAALNGNDYRWRGSVLRSTGEIDIQSRTTRVIVEVPDPYNRENNNRDLPPLENGMFVTVVIEGKTLQGVIPLPRNTIRENNTVWTTDADGKLAFRPVSIARYEGDLAIIESGLSPGDKVVTTNLSGAVPGMKIRHVAPGEQQ